VGSNSEVLIVGAGLAGLNAAIQLEAAGTDVRIIEGSNRAGGRVATDVIDGFICDRGFQLINSQYPALKELDVIKEIDFVLSRLP
jgi:phytoene dehydrogenase-like protein